MRAYYSEYVRHCLRYYVTTLDDGRGGHPQFKSDVDKNNWAACHMVVRNFDDKTIDIVREIYSPGDTIPDKIYHLAKELKVSQDSIWNIINTLERNVAKKRGLL